MLMAVPGYRWWLRTVLAAIFPVIALGTAIGAIVEVTAGGVVRQRLIKGGSSARLQNALAVFFGLGGANQIEAVRVRWPSGTETNLAKLTVDRTLRVIETFDFQHAFESVKASR